MNQKNQLHHSGEVAGQPVESKLSNEDAVNKMLTVCRGECHDLVAKELQSPLLRDIADAYFSGDVQALWAALCALDVDLQNAYHDEDDGFDRERAKESLIRTQQGQFHFYAKDLESFIKNGRQGYIHYLLVDGGYSRIVLTTADDHGVTSDSGNKLFIRCSNRSSSVVQNYLKEMGVTVD